MKIIQGFLRWIKEKTHLFLLILSASFLTISIALYTIDHFSSKSKTTYYKTTLIHLPDAQYCDKNEANSYLNSNFYKLCYNSLIDQFPEYKEAIDYETLESSTYTIPTNYYGQSISIKFSSVISPEFVDNVIKTITTEATQLLKSKYSDQKSSISYYNLDNAVYQIQNYSVIFITGLSFFALAISSALAGSILIHISIRKKKGTENG